MVSIEDVIEFRKNYVKERQKKIDDSVLQVKLQIPKLNAEKDRLTLERERSIKDKTEEFNQEIIRLQKWQADMNQDGDFLTAFYYKIKKWVREQETKYVKYRFQETMRYVTKD